MKFLTKTKIIVMILTLFLITGCNLLMPQTCESPRYETDLSNIQLPENLGEEQQNNQEQQNQQAEPALWMRMELLDVHTNYGFVISQEASQGKPVLLESFAVWCPKCTQQQKEIKKLHEQVGDDVISIAINTDPNENSEIVKEHAESNGFDWKYAVAPAVMTESLIAEFGTGIVSAPSVPKILICSPTQYRRLPSGVLSAEELQQQINEGC